MQMELISCIKVDQQAPDEVVVQDGQLKIFEKTHHRS